MQQSLKRHREEETKNDKRNMTSTEYNKNKAISSLFLRSLKFNLIASVSGWPNVTYVNQWNTTEIIFVDMSNSDLVL